jgi:hypothetical protein
MRVTLCIAGLAAPLVAGFVVQPAAVSLVLPRSSHVLQPYRAPRCLQAPTRQHCTALQMTVNGQGPNESYEKVKSMSQLQVLKLLLDMTLLSEPVRVQLSYSMHHNKLKCRTATSYDYCFNEQHKCKALIFVLTQLILYVLDRQAGAERADRPDWHVQLCAAWRRRAR